MVQQNNWNQNGDDSNTLSVILLSASMMSLVITVMGIKLKWFRHRLTFEQPENQVASPVLLRTTSVTEIRENCARGIYKQTFDEESFIIRDSPKPITNGKTKAKSNNDRQSIFRLPFKSKFNLSRMTSRDDSQNTMSLQVASVHPPSREKDVATLQKNENLKRMIHERLRSQNSASMPDLVNSGDSNFKQNKEKSIDETDQIEELNENVEFTKVGSYNSRQQRASPDIDDVSDDQEIQMYDEKILQKKVKFEEVVEIEEMRIVETKVLAQIENNFVETSTDYLKNYDEELNTEIMPPTPMKRKSREEYFELSTEPETVQENRENEMMIEVETPTVKPRTKRLIHRTSDVSRPIENFPRLEIGTLQEVLQLSDEKPEKLHQEIEAPEMPVEIYPKSILKSSETLSSPKTITFKNQPHTISDSDDDDDTTSTSSSSSSNSDDDESEEDVWSRVNQHRVMLQKKAPPPLPKTPPPSAEEESNQFSFA